MSAALATLIELAFAALFVKWCAVEAVAWRRRRAARAYDASRSSSIILPPRPTTPPTHVRRLDGEQ